MNDYLNDVSLLIVGYDPYKDVWDHYFELLEKYWPERPKTYLATNELTPDYNNVTVIPAGSDAEWSKKVIVALEQIDTPFVVLLLEDFFTTRPVDSSKLAELVACMKNDNLNYCKLLNQSKIKGKVYGGKNYLRIIGEDQDYGISLQPSIWRKDFLSKTVGTENYNAWIFEFNQVKNKIQNQNGIDCIGDRRNVLEITHAVVQSKYLRKAVKVFEKQDYDINLSARPMLSKKDNFKYRLKCSVAEKTPKFLKPVLKKVGKLMKVDFVSDRQLKEKKK